MAYIIDEGAIDNFVNLLIGRVASGKTDKLKKIIEKDPYMKDLAAQIEKVKGDIAQHVADRRKDPTFDYQYRELLKKKGYTE